MLEEAPRSELERLQTQNARDVELLANWPPLTAELRDLQHQKKLLESQVADQRGKLSALREREELLRDNLSNELIRKARKKNKKKRGVPAPWDSHWNTVGVSGTLGMIGSMALLHHLAITPPVWAAVLSTTVGIATPLVVDYLRIARAMGKRAPK